MCRGSARRSPASSLVAGCPSPSCTHAPLHHKCKYSLPPNFGEQFCSLRLPSQLSVHPLRCPPFLPAHAFIWASHQLHRITSNTRGSRLHEHAPFSHQLTPIAPPTMAIKEQLPSATEVAKEVKEEVKSATNSTLQSLRSLAAGGVGGVCAVIVGHPFDLVKVRLQTAERGVYSGAMDVVRRTIAREGLARVCPFPWSWRICSNGSLIFLRRRGSTQVYPRRW